MTPRRIAVVVPTRDAARTLGRCLASVRAQTDAAGGPLPVTLVVVDNCSGDDTVAVAAPLADAVATVGPERSAQRNAGAQLASEIEPATEVVLFVDADMVLEATVCSEVLDALDAAGAMGRPGAVVVPERSFGDGFWAACRALEKRIVDGDPRTEAARAFGVELLRDIGGWAEDLTAGEDWDLTDRAVAAGALLTRTRAVIHHDEGRPTLRGVFRKKRYYGQWMAAYQARSRERVGGAHPVRRVA